MGLLSGVTSMHVVVQPSPWSVSRTFSSFPVETSVLLQQYLPAPSSGNCHYEFGYSSFLI